MMMLEPAPAARSSGAEAAGRAQHGADEGSGGDNDRRRAPALALLRCRGYAGRMSDVAERVKKIVVEHLGVDEAKVTENASFIDDLGGDSLDAAELVIAFEEEFGCYIPDDAAQKIATVKDAVSFIEGSGGSRVSAQNTRDR
jgi:acyl carrier protein